MRILSTDAKDGVMTSRIPKSAIKKLVGRKGIMVSDEAASAISKILEAKAAEIARYAVSRAKKNSRSTILGEDVDTYRMKHGG